MSSMKVMSKPCKGAASIGKTISYPAWTKRTNEEAAQGYICPLLISTMLVTTLGAGKLTPPKPMVKLDILQHQTRRKECGLGPDADPRPKILNTPAGYTNI